MSLNDDEFSRAYYNIICGERLRGGSNKNEDFMCAFISNIDIIHRCIAVDGYILQKVISALSRIKRYIINLNVESCKLLHENGCDMSILLLLARIANNYDSVKYIIESMSVDELSRALHNKPDSNLLDILLIDRIYLTNDKSLIALLIDHILISIEYTNNILICYVIIKHMTHEEGKNMWDKRIHRLDSMNLNITEIKFIKTLFNIILYFHFKPRGSHTKAARIY
jgi:hypothetical protein